MATDRCQKCNRDGCRALANAMTTEERKAYARLLEASELGQRINADTRATIEAAANRGADALADCRAHAVDWRARALAAERLAEEAAAHGAGSDALIDAICQRVGARDTGSGGQTVEAGEMRRRVDLTRRIDLLAADAARWHRVAPLIDKLAAAINAWDVADPMGRAIGKARLDAYTAAEAILAATTDRASTPEGATTP